MQRLVMAPRNLYFFADAARINAELYPLMAGRLTETFCHHQTKRILLRCGGLVTLAEPEKKLVADARDTETTCEERFHQF
jgi:hypothetical protein